MKLWLVLGICLSLMACNLTGTDNTGETPIPPTQETPLPSGSPIQFYLIALEDTSGTSVGCGDSIVAVNTGQSVEGSLQNDLRTALEALFALKEESYGQSGLVTSLHTTNMQIESITVNGDSTIINMGGVFSLAGVCSDARMQAQILHTVFQFPEVNSAAIYINGQNMKQLFDASGLEVEDTPYTRADF